MDLYLWGVRPPSWLFNFFYQLLDCFVYKMDEKCKKMSSPSKNLQSEAATIGLTWTHRADTWLMCLTDFKKKRLLINFELNNLPIHCSSQCWFLCNLLLWAFVHSRRLKGRNVNQTSCYEGSTSVSWDNLSSLILDSLSLFSHDKALHC